MISDEPPFEIMSNGAQSNPQDSRDSRDSRKSIQIVPLSFRGILEASDQLQDEADLEQDFIRFGRKKQLQNQAEIKISNPNPDPHSDSDSDSETRVKPEPSAAENEDEEKKYVDLDSGNELNLQQQVVKLLKAEVENLRKFKSRVQHAASGGSDEIDEKRAVAKAPSPKHPKQWQFKGKSSKYGEALVLGMFFLLLAFLLAKAFTNCETKCGNAAQENIRKVIKETLKEILHKDKLTESIHLYSQTNYRGSKHVVFSRHLNQNNCYNLDKMGADFASSIDTQGECVYVFEHSDCRGKKQKFSPQTQDHQNFNKWGLDRKISSIQACYKHKD